MGRDQMEPVVPLQCGADGEGALEGARAGRSGAGLGHGAGEPVVLVLG